MKILIVDDEAAAVWDLQEKLMKISTNFDIMSFTKVQEALEASRRVQFDIAFLDVEIGKMNGIVLAKMLKDINTEIKIIFVTAFAQYAVEAFSLHVSGYLLKPVKLEEMEQELTFAYDLIPEKRNRDIRVTTFGGFEVFADGVPVNFKRSKAKELFAYLVDKRGVSVTTREACAILWEDAPYSKAQKNYFQVIVMDMKFALKQAGIEDVLVKKRNAISIIPQMLDCDAYRFREGDVQAVNAYRRDYMICYSWAEFTMGLLEGQTKEKET